MNQVVGPFAPPQPTGFAAYPSYYAQGGSVQQQTSAASQAPSQAFAPAGYYYPNDGHNLMQPQPFAGGQQYPYTSAQYSYSVPAQAPSAPAPVAQGPQQQNLRQSQSASPQQQSSPNAANQHAPPQQHYTPPTTYPMSAPPVPQTPASQQQAVNNGTAPSPQSPQSPSSQNREAQRVALLLELNVELLQEVNRLQGEGKGGACSPQQQAQLKNQGQPDHMASDEYFQTLRRVQANLGYLMPTAQNDANKKPTGPAHMTPPAHMPHLQPMYDQLKELFPGWQGYDHRLSQSSSSPRPNGMNAQQSAPSAPVQA